MQKQVVGEAMEREMGGMLVYECGGQRITLALVLALCYV